MDKFSILIKYKFDRNINICIQFIGEKVLCDLFFVINVYLK